MRLEEAPFNLQTALEDIVTLLAPKGAEKNVEITLRYQPSLPVGFIGDVGRIRQIITNIAGNAVKFTPSGYVFIDVTGEQDGSDYRLQIKVVDTGIGIDQKMIDRIFGEFEQVESDATRSFEGTGLGLAISTRLVELMGGKISVISEPDKGSEFTVRMTLTTCDLPAPSQPLAEIDLRQRKVLIVDDLELNRRILFERLSSWGMQPTLAASGEEALEILDDQIQDNSAFDLVIQDYQMPGLDGEDLASQIRERASAEVLPIIILSSVEAPLDPETRIALGIQELMLKPIRSDLLNAIIKRCFSPTPENLTETSGNTPQQEPFPAMKLLVAEDNKTNRLVVRKMLRSTKASVTFAENGLIALSQYREFHPDIVLMDMSMPEMDGLEATKEIRNIEASENLNRCPIIALTANAMPADRDRCLQAGMDDFLSKPIRKDQLISSISKWTPRPDEAEASS